MGSFPTAGAVVCGAVGAHSPHRPDRFDELNRIGIRGEYGLS